MSRTALYRRAAIAARASRNPSWAAVSAFMSSSRSEPGLVSASLRSSRISVSSAISECASVSCRSRPMRSRSRTTAAYLFSSLIRSTSRVRAATRASSSAFRARSDARSRCSPSTSVRRDAPMRAASSAPGGTTRTFASPSRIASADRAIAASPRIRRAVDAIPITAPISPSSSSPAKIWCSSSRAAANAVDVGSRTHTVHPSPGKVPAPSLTA